MKVTPSKNSSQVTFKTRETLKKAQITKWWTASSQKELIDQVIGCAVFLKENQSYRQRQASIFSRLYGNQTLYNFVGSNIQRLDQTVGLPQDRPTFNVVQSCSDTLVSKIGQSRPAPVFLTDNADYKQRNLAKKLNNFIQGEFYQAKAYEKAPCILRDALIMGTGCLKVTETDDHKVGLERRLYTELFIDPNEAIYGEPRQLFEIKLVDRNVLKAIWSNDKAAIDKAETAFPDQSAETSKSVADLVMVVEAWHLPSAKNAGDGRHVIVCSSGVLRDIKYTKPRFPFVFLHYSPRLLGFWSQGLAEQLMGTQMEINSLLYTISRAIRLVGVPRVFQEMGSKVTKASNNNDIGVIIEYSGVKPSYEVAPCNAPELYQQLERIIQFAYQQSGVSAMQATSQKPAGLDSGQAIRSYDDISNDRFSSLARKYDDFFIELTYLMIDKAKDICKEQGSYATVYPNKNGVKEINLPEAKLLQNPFVIQCFNQSSLPKDPAGRMQKVIEMIQAGMISIREGRRLLDYPDLDQVEKLANASEERILQILDEIIEGPIETDEDREKTYTPPDVFMDLELANQLVVQYYNLYSNLKLEPERCQMLRTFFNQIQDLKAKAEPQAAQGVPNPPQANPQPLPQSQLVSNANGPVAA